MKTVITVVVTAIVTLVVLAIILVSISFNNRITNIEKFLIAAQQRVQPVSASVPVKQPVPSSTR